MKMYSCVNIVGHVARGGKANSKSRSRWVDYISDYISGNVFHALQERKDLNLSVPVYQMPCITGTKGSHSVFAAAAGRRMAHPATPTTLQTPPICTTSLKDDLHTVKLIIQLIIQ
jgi:hypothetical protein